MPRLIGFEELLPCPYNRTVDKNKVKTIREAIEYSGEVKPFVLAEIATDDGKRMMITDGHHRYLAIKELIRSRKIKKDVSVPYMVSGDLGTETAKSEPHDRIRENSKLPGSHDVALKPIEDKESYSDYLFGIIDYELFNFLYKPFLQILMPGNIRRENSKYDLKRALLSGRVEYQDGYVYGKFNATVAAAIRSLGGEFNHNKKAYKISLAKLPSDVQQAIAIGNTRNEETKAKIKSQMDVLEQSSFFEPRGVKIDFQDHLNKVIGDLEKQFRSSSSPYIEFLPEITESMKRGIAANYTQNLDLYVKNWEEEAVVRLREKVNQNFLEGFRADSMTETIMSEYGVTRRKAKFLARQETSLMAAQFRQERYKDIGIQKYRWSTSHDERVRPDHKALSGLMFSFDLPPVTNTKTGAKNNPGQDYNCRCKPVAVLSTRHIDRQEPVKETAYA